ncbi:hypothetical protein NW765_004437 [Fusarium oxysporum]|nr:hypothetical protein NW765_004437 [Fusarium oxysporum]
MDSKDRQLYHVPAGWLCVAYDNNLQPRCLQCLCVPNGHDTNNLSIDRVIHITPLTETDLDSRNHSTLEVAPSPRADSDCLPQAVIHDAPELALVEYAHNRDNLPMISTTPQTNIEYASGLEVIPAPPGSNTVTPLHLLGDQPEAIDCPFCLRRSETRVKKKPSSTTHLQAVALLMTTVCGAVAPYMAKWSFDIEHICDNCQNRVMYRARGKDIRICKAPAAWKEESKYPDVKNSMSPVTQ